MQVFLLLILAAQCLVYESCYMNEPAPSFTIIGSGTCMPSVKRRAPGNLLQVNGRGYLIDTGPGILQACAADGFDTKDLAGVFLYSFSF